MLARLNRFHGHGNVRRTYRLGKPVRGSMMSMHVLAGPRVKNTKVAVVVSRKVHKSAVKRNRIRRRIYENIRPRLPALPQPTEVVITVFQPELADMPAPGIDQAVSELFTKAQLS